MSTLQLTEFERGLMDALLVGDDPFLSQLRHQLEMAAVKSRELTGCGLYIDFAVPAGVPRVVPSEFKIGDVLFEIEGLQHGGGAILHGESGELGVLEAYSNGIDWPEEATRFEISYFGGKRDLAGLMKEVHGRA